MEKVELEEILEASVGRCFGLAAAALSFTLLFTDRSLKRPDNRRCVSVPPPNPLHRLRMAFCSVVVAYARWPGMTAIALLYLGRKLPWRFTSLVALTTYALAHNIGASARLGRHRPLSRPID